MQGYDDESVFFYEDILYYTGAEDIDKTAALKKQNDWGKELDKSKMTQRYVFAKTGYDMYFYYHGKKDETIGIKNYDRLKNGFIKLFNGSKVSLALSEYDSNGLIIVFAIIENTDGSQNKVIALCSDEENTLLSDDSDLILGFVEYDVETCLEDTIPLIKSKNGWTYTYVK